MSAETQTTTCYAPPWSVILFTALAGTGQGLFLALYGADALGAATPLFLRDGTLVALLLLAAGLAMWRGSWLSREVIVLSLLVALLALYAFLQWSGIQATLLAGGLAALACFALFLCTGRSALTVANFTLIGCATGLSAAAALAAWLEPGLTRPYVGAALLAGFFAYLGRLALLVRNARLRPKSRPLHLVRAVRWTFLLLLYPVPAVLLVNELEAAAFAVQWLGVLAERWYFFAEAG